MIQDITLDSYEFNFSYLRNRAHTHNAHRPAACIDIHSLTAAVHYCVFVLLQVPPQ